MTLPERPVDRAMAEERPEKVTIRNLWMQEIETIAGNPPPPDEPWLLTIPGSEGQEIQQIIDGGYVSLTEAGSIAQDDINKIVAVESSNRAVASLQKKFPGLRIKEGDFRSLIRAEHSFKWPQGEDEKYCRASIVNLDLNIPLVAEIIEGQVVFPVPAWIDKLCEIHAKPPRRDWTLCLTLHGEVVWPEDVNRHTRVFLIENLGREPDFAGDCMDFFGGDLYALITRENGVDFTDLERSEQQKVIMVMIPKIIARLVHNKGWRVKTERNLRYGDVGHAPMVTWIVKFSWDPQAMAEPDATYREALRDILTGAGIVNARGRIVPFGRQG